MYNLTYWVEGMNPVIPDEVLAVINKYKLDITGISGTYDSIFVSIVTTSEDIANELMRDYQFDNDSDILWE